MASREIIKVVLVERRQAIVSAAPDNRAGISSAQSAVFELRPLDLSKSVLKAFIGPDAAFDFLDKHRQSYELASRVLINKWFDSAAFRKYAERKTVSNVIRWLDKYTGLGVEQIFYYDAETQQHIPGDQLKGPTVWLFSESGFLCPCESTDAAFSEIERAREVLRLRHETKVAAKKSTPAQPPRMTTPPRWK